MPVTDLGLRNAMKRTYLLEELPTPNRIIEIVNAWRTYRSIAMPCGICGSHYLISILLAEKICGWNISDILIAM